jgi:cell division protease FtsH
VNLEVVARGTPGLSGADLANLINEAAIVAVRADREVLTAADFDEAGHALVAAYSANADPVAKVTILPAGQALGVTEQLPLVERHLYGEGYLYDTLAVCLGGRASQLVEPGTGR